MSVYEGMHSIHDCGGVCMHDCVWGVCMHELRKPVEFPGVEL